MKRHKYVSWTVKVHGKQVGQGFKTEAMAKTYAASREGGTVHSSVEYGDCAKVATSNPSAFCAACANKIPFTGSAGF